MTDGDGDEKQGNNSQQEEEREAPPNPLTEGFVQEETVLLVEDESQTAEPAQNFVNEGFHRWEENRASWLQMGSDGGTSTSTSAVPIEVDAIIDVIFSQRWRTQDEDSLFPQPVPLPQMVDILVDLWEAEGLDV